MLKSRPSAFLQGSEQPPQLGPGKKLHRHFFFFAVKNVKNCTVEELKPLGKEIPPELKTGHVKKGRNSWGWLREALA